MGRGPGYSVLTCTEQPAVAKHVHLTRRGKLEAGPGWTWVETETSEKGTRWNVQCTDWQSVGAHVVDLVLPFKVQEIALCPMPMLILRCAITILSILS